MNSHRHTSSRQFKTPSTGWHLFDPVGEIGVPQAEERRALLLSRLPSEVPADPALCLVPLCWPPGEIFPAEGCWPPLLEGLLTLIPRDALLACNSAALDLAGQPQPLRDSACEWLLRAVRANVRIIHAAETSSLAAPALEAELLPELVPARPGRDREWRLAALHQSEFCGLKEMPGEAPAAIALQAALYGWHDYLEESHRCSQQIEGLGPGQCGDYWHAIMHRREPDYDNAKYWFRRVGSAVPGQQLSAPATAILSACPASEAPHWLSRLVPAAGRWDAFSMVDFCAACEQRRDELGAAARRIQFLEMQLLLGETLRHAQQRE